MDKDNITSNCEYDAGCMISSVYLGVVCMAGSSLNIAALIKAVKVSYRTGNTLP